MATESKELETEEEEVETYEIVGEEEEVTEKPEKTIKVIRKKKEKADKTKIITKPETEPKDVDETKCPKCGSENIGRDYKIDVYKCLDCEHTYVIEEE